MSARLAAALGYAAAGFRVLPLIGKRPPFGDWPNRASRDPAVIREWWRAYRDPNVGLLCGDGLLVLDVDGNDARHELERLEAHYGPLPPAPMVATGRDGYGRHLYFAAARSAPSWVMWRGDNGHELAVKATGCQVVAPPSVHPDTGREYVWIDRPPLAQAPAWLLQRPAVRDAPRAPATGLFADPLLRVPAEVYVPLLTGHGVGRDRKTTCPLHSDEHPSLHVYPGDRGWCCFQCGRGGTAIDLAAALWGLGTRGEDYREVRRRLVGLLVHEARV